MILPPVVRHRVTGIPNPSGLSVDWFVNPEKAFRNMRVAPEQRGNILDI
jgi:hypothetical protein